MTHTPIRSARNLMVRALAARIYGLGVAGRTAERAELVARLERLVGASGTPQQRHVFRQAKVALLCYRGQVAEAETLSTDGYAETSAAGLEDALLRYAAQLFVIRELQGRFDEIVDLFCDVAKSADSTPAAVTAAAFMLCHLDRIDEARATFPITIEYLTDVPNDQSWSTTLHCAAYVVSRTGDVEVADWLYEQLMPVAHLFANTFVTTTASLYQPLGLLARTLHRTDDAITHFRAAIDAHRSAEALFWEAESQIELAATLLGRDRPDDHAEATDLLTTAAATADTYGFAGLTRHITTLR